MRDNDDSAYLKYTGPQRVDKAMHSLKGIIRGIAIDDEVNDKELCAIAEWMSEHREYADRHPFSEVRGRLNEIIEDRVVDQEERADILWLCDKFSTENRFFNAVSSDMQRLQGILRGIVADGQISEAELHGLQDWMEDKEHLRTCWPYVELDALITSILADGIIDPLEHETLIRFFSEFINHSDHRAIDFRTSEIDVSIQGVCAVAPEICFPNRKFCFTGESERLTRRELANQVAERGGLFSANVTKTVDFLIVGAGGNPCWAYACYGRKVEAAVTLRKQGHPLLIVHEYDYWDAIEDHT